MNNFALRLSFAAALLMQSVLACGLACGQSQTPSLAADTEPAVAVAPASALPTQVPATDSLLTIADPGSLAAYSPLDTSASSAEVDATPTWAASPALPVPPPKPRPHYYNENPNKWQLGVAVALVRFRSSVYYASAPGFNTSLAYWWKEWVAIEGSVTTAFAPPVFANEHFRYLSYAAGPKFSFGHGRLEPWAHALAGGVHLIPQTASGGQNGAEITLGGGVDYVINDVISAKAGVDYLGTHMFGEWQSSAQIVAGFSFRF